MADLASQWKAFTPEQRDKALSKMTPDQKMKLASALGYNKTKGTPSVIGAPQPEARTLGNYASEVVHGAGRGAKDVGSALVQTIAHPVDTATQLYSGTQRAIEDAQKEERDLRTTYPRNVPNPIESVKNNLTRGTAAALTFLEENPVTGSLVQHAEQGRGLASPESVGAGVEGAMQVAVPEVAGRVLPIAAGGAKTTLNRGVEVATGTGPRVTANLVKETAKENEAAAAKAAEETAKREKAHAEAVAKQQEKRTAQVQQYGKKLSETRAATAEKQGQISRKVALQRGVERLDSGLKDDLKATEERVNAEANKKYNDLRAKLKDEKAPAYQAVDEEGHISGEPTPLPEHLYEVANTPLRGTETESTIIKSLGKRVQTGETTLTYNDLQGYREEIGRQLRKGTLEPDIYTAYKKLMPEIDRAMQQIADRHGLGGAQNEARTFYRRYAEAFIDHDSPIRKALDSTERGQVTKSFGGKDQSGIQRLAQFNPELAKSINTVRGYAEEARGIRPSGTTPKEPTLAPKPGEIPKPEAVTPEVKKIPPESIRAAKAEGLAKRARDIQHYTGRAALYVTGYRSLVALGRAATGDASALAAIPADIGEGIAVAGGGAFMARVLESSKVVELLTKPTARDIAKIPPEMRSDLLPVIQAAQKRGVKVAPTLLAAVTGSRNYPRGPNTRKLESLRGQPATSQP